MHPEETAPFRKVRGFSFSVAMKLRTLRPRVAEVANRQFGIAGTARIRGGRLQRIRRDHFQRNPLCKRCEARGLVALAVEIDHVIPLHKGGADDESNRQGLCADCHRAKTREDLRP